MEKKRACVNVYNFIRMSHNEPTRFIVDDFETIRNEIITVKQYGFPGTYALKYDALMDSRYQELLRQYLDENDEVSAWWEITRDLCQRSGVTFRDSWNAEEYDDRVDSAYSIGYSVEERKLLLDGYMADFYSVFGKYPQTIGSWVLDSVTMAYASERYGVCACAICRDQMGVDGFTLWGGYPNGAYYPSKNNENIPARNPINQLPIPVFRLLGPDPIYNFEADVRDGIPGVYTLEPAWLIGRDPKWINWLFNRLTEEDSIGMGYAHVGQENNFLWENIEPGFAPQFDVIRELHKQGKIRVETMAQTAKWFTQKYRVTPPMTYQASEDWSERKLSCQWYASANYRVGFLGEEGHLRIRDLFLYDENYASRYLHGPMKGTKSNFDALPVLFPQLWKPELGQRPYIRLVDAQGEEPAGQICYSTVDDLRAEAVLKREKDVFRFVMDPSSIRFYGDCSLVADALPVFSCVDGDTLYMIHEGFSYSLKVTRGTVARAGKDGFALVPDQGELVLEFAPPMNGTDIYCPEYLRDPDILDSEQPPKIIPGLDIPAFAPEFIEKESVFAIGDTAYVRLTAKDPGVIRYTLDGTEPELDSSVYVEPVAVTEDCKVCARLFCSDGRVSAVASREYVFCEMAMKLESPTNLDRREVFFGNGISDLLNGIRGSLDYLDGNWRGSLEGFDVTAVLETPSQVSTVSMGFLSHHRSGIVYPQRVELYGGDDAQHMVLLDSVELYNGPGEREIEKQDVVMKVHKKIGAFRIVAYRYARMPEWCTYRGTPTVFTMADCLIVKP